MAGLVRKKITVRGKSGKTFQRSVMVRAGEAVKRTAGKVGRFVNKHKGKIAGAAALASAAYLGVRHGSQIAGAAKGLHAAISGHLAERREAKAAGRSMAKGSLRNAISGQVRSGREAGREADNARMGKAREAVGRGAVRAAGAVDHATRHLQYGARAYKAIRELGGNRRTAAKGAILVHRESRATR